MQQQRPTGTPAQPEWVPVFLYTTMGRKIGDLERALTGPEVLGITCGTILQSRLGLPDGTLLVLLNELKAAFLLIGEDWTKSRVTCFHLLVINDRWVCCTDPGEDPYQVMQQEAGWFDTKECCYDDPRTDRPVPTFELVINPWAAFHRHWEALQQVKAQQGQEALPDEEVPGESA